MSQAVSSKWSFHPRTSPIPNTAKDIQQKEEHGFSHLNKIINKYSSKNDAIDTQKNEDSHSPAPAENSKLIEKPKDQGRENQKRRSRNDQQGRDFTCGCGKKYLSYPALWTHIKQKHDGKEIEGTRRTLTGPRGRPRKEGSSVKQDSPKSLNKVGSKGLEEKPKIEQHRPIYPKIHSFPLKKPSMKLFEEYFDIVQGNSVAEDRITCSKFVKQIEMIREKDTKEISKLSIDGALAIFLYNMADECNPGFLKYLQQTLESFRSCLNQHNKTMAQDFQLPNRVFNIETVHDSLNQGKEYCESTTCELVPLMCEYFVTKYAPDSVKKDEKLLACVMDDLCGWMNEHKMCHFKISRAERQGPSDFMDEIYLQ